MAHTEATVAGVRGILPTGTQLTDAQITAGIAAAHCTVEDLIQCCAYYADDCLTLIETYLAAHYAAVTENTLSLSSENDGCSGSSVTYGFVFGDGIKGTPFGQTANTLSRGCLAEFDKPPTNLVSLGSI